MNNDNYLNAYGTLIRGVASNNLGKYLLSKDDYIFLGKNDKLFLDILDDNIAKNSASNFLEDYFKSNPEKLNDLKLGKSILSRIKLYDDIKFCFNLFKYSDFKDDMNVISNLVVNSSGSFFDFLRIDLKIDTEHLTTSEALRDSVMNYPSFSLSWFDLPEPNDRNVILNCLKNNYNDFFVLSKKSQQDKDFIFAALNSSKAESATLDSFYDCLDENNKIDKEICESLLEKRFVKFDIRNFDEDFLEKFLSSHFTRKPKKIKMHMNDMKDQIPGEIFANNKMLKVLVDWIVDNRVYLHTDRINYQHFYGAMKKFSKYSPYIKEKIKNSKVWKLGTASEIYSLPNSSFDMFFIENMAIIKKEIDVIVHNEQLEITLSSKNSNTKRIKI